MVKSWNSCAYKAKGVHGKSALLYQVMDKILDISCARPSSASSIMISQRNTCTWAI